MRTDRTSQLGITLVEVLIVAALVTLVFGGLFAGTRYSLQLIQQSRIQLSALSLANDRMEQFRSLPYDDVGTVGGIPAGTIPQVSTTTLNGIDFVERILVEYVDDPADGQLTATTTDNNGIPADYKRIKIQISWTAYEVPGELAIVSNIVPRSIESTVGGGTVRVNVLDADSTFLPGAEVRLVNTNTTSTIDVIRYTDANGTALFSGAPAASGYEVFVTNTGFSSDQTYQASASNPIPNTAPFAVLESDISTVTFQIGELSTVAVQTYSAIATDESIESFNDTSGIGTTTDIEIVGGTASLRDSGGLYESTGELYLEALTPASVASWEALSVVADTPANTTYSVQLYTGTSTSYTLISDSDLPGNSTGFTGANIDISDLSAASYPTIVVGVTLTTGDTTITPTIDELGVFYRTAQTVRANTGFTMVGTKTIGTELDTTPIYKVDTTFSTDAVGQESLTDVEFDTYTITNTSGLTVAYACPNIPLTVGAGTSQLLEMLLIPGVTDSLRVAVEDISGQPLPGATVEVARPGYSDTKITNACGQVFFDTGITSNSDYTITISKTGYVDETFTPTVISGETLLESVLNEL